MTTEQAIEVGDKVTYSPVPGANLEDVWARRVGREYLVIQVWDHGQPRHYRMQEITPPANRHNRIEPDWWSGSDHNVRLLAKATYTPVED